MSSICVVVVAGTVFELVLALALVLALVAVGVDAVGSTVSGPVWSATFTAAASTGASVTALLPPQPAANSARATTPIRTLFTIRVCHPSSEGAVGVSDALGVDTYSRQVARTKRSPRRTVPGLVTSA